MDSIKIRRAVKVVVKYSFVVIVLITASYNSTLGQVLQGTFSGSDGKTYHFINDSTSKVVSLLHVGKRIEKGDYTINDDTLCLDFEPTEDPSPSGFEFVKRKQNPVPHLSTSRDTVGFTVHFNIVNEEEKPIQGAILALLNKNESAIMGFNADSLGNFPQLSIVNSYINKFRFSFLGYEELEISADTLAGHTSKVEVVLSNNETYSKYDGTEKYLISSLKRNKVTLKNLKTGEKLILVREDPDNK
jgi:hypothetical protein